MQCISPIWLRNLNHSVPCGKCNFCLQNRRAEWSFRLLQELKSAQSAEFLTLTYHDQCLPFSATGFPELCKRDLQLFWKRLRKAHGQRASGGVVPSAWPKLRYYCVGEYGPQTSRPHYHAIVFNIHPEIKLTLDIIWQNGFIDAGTVTVASVNYVTSYIITKPGEYGDKVPPFALMSRRPGIGTDYVRLMRRYHRSAYGIQAFRDYVMMDGCKKRMPRIYRDKIFSKFEKEVLFLKVLGGMDERYALEIERLSRFHPDPTNYYDERLRVAHDAIRDKNDRKKGNVSKLL